MLVIFALLFAFAPAHAGDVVVSSTVPAEVEVHGTSIARLSMPGSLTLSGMDAGTYTFVVVRGPGDRTSVPIHVPALGAVKLEIGVATATTDSPGDAEGADAAPPAVVIRGASGQRFGVLVGGARRAVLEADQVLNLDDLGPGEHLVQFRSADYQTIWAKGALTLQAGDQVELFVEEGRMVTVLGRAGTWKPR